MKNQARRYEQRKLNYKKVFGTIIVFVLIIYAIVSITKMVKAQKNTAEVAQNKYFTVFENELYGVINQYGEYIIEPCYQEMIQIPNNNRDIFIITYGVDYSTGTYYTKAVNSQNLQILDNFEKIEPISYYSNGEITYATNLLKYEENGKYGLIDFEGNIIFQSTFDQIESIPSRKDYLLTINNGLYGLIDTSGNIIIENNYISITPLVNGSSFIVTNEKSGIIDKTGQVILPLEYDQISDISTDELFVIGDKATLEILDKTQTQVMSSGIFEVKDIGRNVIYKSPTGLYGVKSIQGEDVIEATYEDIKFAFQDNFIVKNGLYGLVDKTQNTLIPFEFADITYYSTNDFYVCDTDQIYSKIYNNKFEQVAQGIILEITDNYIKLSDDGTIKYYNYSFEEIEEDTLFNNELTVYKENGKYGFKDKKGNVVVDAIYDDITSQNEYGFIGVKKDDKWGAIDSSGNLAVNTIYNLDDYLNIDFIGKFHRGIDYNIVYFTTEDEV